MLCKSDINHIAKLYINYSAKISIFTVSLSRLQASPRSGSPTPGCPRTPRPRRPLRPSRTRSVLPPALPPTRSRSGEAIQVMKESIKMRGNKPWSVPASSWPRQPQQYL